MTRNSTPPTNLERFAVDHLRSTMIRHEDARDTLWHRDRALAALTGSAEDADHPARERARRMAAAAHVVTSISLSDAYDVAAHAVMVDPEDRAQVIRRRSLDVFAELPAIDAVREAEAVVHAMIEVRGG